MSETLIIAAIAFIDGFWLLTPNRNLNPRKQLLIEVAGIGFCIYGLVSVVSIIF